MQVARFEMQGAGKNSKEIQLFGAVIRLVSIVFDSFTFCLVSFALVLPNCNAGISFHGVVQNIF